MCSNKTNNAFYLLFLYLSYQKINISTRKWGLKRNPLNILTNIYVITYYNEKNIINSYNVNACQLSYMQNTKKKKGWNKNKDI